MGTRLGFDVIGIACIFQGLSWWLRLLCRPLLGVGGVDRFTGCCGRQSRIELSIRIILPMIALGFEVHNTPLRQYSWRDPKHVEKIAENLDHMTVYCGFIISGLVELLQKPLRFRPHISHAVLAQVFLLASILSKPPPDNLMMNDQDMMEMSNLVEHTCFLMLAVVQFGLACTMTLEIFTKHSFILACVRCYLAILHGTWLIQTGEALYHYRWDDLVWHVNEPMKNMMFIPPLFGLHAIGISVFLVITFGLIQRYRGRRLAVGYRGVTHHAGDDDNGFNYNGDDDGDDDSSSDDDGSVRLHTAPSVLEMSRPMYTLDDMEEDALTQPSDDHKRRHRETNDPGPEDIPLTFGDDWS